jgi:hypothetical protein
MRRKQKQQQHRRKGAKSMIPKKPALGLDPRVADFSDKIMRQNRNLEQSRNSTASDLAQGSALRLLFLNVLARVAFRDRRSCRLRRRRLGTARRGRPR